MKDRVPGSPGQFCATVDSSQLQKLQRGEPFAITLKRDHQPIVEGTPFSKAAVLPDALAVRLCPQLDDPSPADAFAALADRGVVSLGEKDGWKYRQWANGMAECWTTIYNPFSADVLFLPLAIKDPVAIATFESSDNIFLTPATFEWFSDNINDYMDFFVVMAKCYDAGTLDKIPSPTSVRMHLYITGEWKDIISSGDYPVWEGGLY